MPEQRPSLGRAVVVVIAAASLALPVVAVAQADQPASATHTAKAHTKKPKHSHYTYRRPPESTSQLYGCTWPYRNMGPPCWSTFPQGDPNYHGVRPGIGPQ